MAIDGSVAGETVGLKRKRGIYTGSLSQASIKASYGFVYAAISTPERSSNLFWESAVGGNEDDISKDQM